MKILFDAGTSLNAPAHSRFALMSAYTSGADVLKLTLQLTSDNILVLCSSDSIYPNTLQEGLISEMTLDQLYSKDFSESFKPLNSPTFSYYNKQVPSRRLSIETFNEMVRFLPKECIFLLELGDIKVENIINGLCEVVTSYGIESRCVFSIKNINHLFAIRRKLPNTKCVIAYEEINEELVTSILSENCIDGIIIDFEKIFNPSYTLTDFGITIKNYFIHSKNHIGCILKHSDNSNISINEFKKIIYEDWIWAFTTSSTVEIDSFTRKQFSVINESFNGTVFNTRKFALGYAKANQYAFVYQKDGIHIDIKPYDGNFDIPLDPLERRLLQIEQKLTNTAKDWPYYSGGGIGVLEGITGDFKAEVDYEVERVCQASTLEMALVNVDPGSHVSHVPSSFRDKDAFYDPHGSPPFVGVEHDEDDGLRINWNYGNDYDNNGYGRPVGNGKDVLSGRLRIERRGNYFSTYYKNKVDALDWVCVGVTRNDSMNNKIFLRCVGKRWRQEDQNNPSVYLPIVPNHFIFKQLNIIQYV